MYFVYGSMQSDYFYGISQRGKLVDDLCGEHYEAEIKKLEAEGSVFEESVLFEIMSDYMDENPTIAVAEKYTKFSLYASFENEKMVSFWLIASSDNPIRELEQSKK